jgi:hypothetical protein
MSVLVVARTRMTGNHVCVGGLELETGRSLRLLGSDGWNLLEEHPIRPGEIWELAYKDHPGPVPPHVEDVIVSHGHKVEEVDDMKATILGLIEPWRGGVDAIFDGRLVATDGGSGYVTRDPPLPTTSTGFWIASGALQRKTFDTATRYALPGGGPIRSVKYVGMADSIPTIPSGALVRFSLARWAAFPPGVDDERCYLQLSGWYT